MKLKPRDIALIVIGLSLVVVLSWYFVWYQPQQDLIAQKQTEKEDVTAQLDRAKAAQAALPQIREEVARLEIEKAEFLRQLPETVRFGDFLQDLRRIVAESGSTLNSISPTAANAANLNLPAGVVAINVDLSLETSFPGLLRAVSAIQNLQRFSTINNIDLTLNTSQNSGPISNPTLQTDVKLTVYTFDVNKALEQQNAAPAQPGTTPAEPGQTPAPQGGNAS